MVDDADLQGLDPYDLMQREAERLDQFFVGLDDAAWSRRSRCAGWSVRDMLAHLLSSSSTTPPHSTEPSETFSPMSARGVRPIFRRRTSWAFASSTTTRLRS